MSGCTNCKGKSGCDDRKGPMLEEVERVLSTLYPSRTWGEVVEPVEALGSIDELAGLAEELATVLAAATFVRSGSDDEPCDYIDILCLGRTPCIVQVRDHGIGIPDEWRSTGSIQEMYLRIVISHRARVAAVQQVAIDVTAAPDGWVIREQPRAGVYDAPLLKRMQKLVAVLPAYDLLHLDFGEIAHAPPGFDPGTWTTLYGAAPAIANYLFYPHPTTMITTQFVPEREAA